MSTHNLCFGAKIRKIGNPCIPQFYYIKVGFKGVYFTRICFPDVSSGFETKTRVSHLWILPLSHHAPQLDRIKSSLCLPKKNKKRSTEQCQKKSKAQKFRGKYY